MSTPATASKLVSTILRAPRPVFGPCSEPDRKLLERMTLAQRRQAMWNGELTYAQCCWWAGRHPDQVPRINGEFAFIAALEAEAAEADR